MQNKKNNNTAEMLEEFNKRNNLEIEKEHIKNLTPEEQAQIGLL